MKKFKIGVFLSVALFLLILSSCNPDLNYGDIVDACTENSVVLEFTAKDGKKTGFAHTVSTSCIIGAPLPDFEAVDITGNKISTASVRGKITIFNFWFTTCAPCIAEIPGLNQIKEKYGEEKINYISFCRGDLETVNRFLVKHPLNYDIIPDGRELTEKTFRSMWGYPLNIVTNEENVVIYAEDGGPTNDTDPKVIFEKLSLVLDEALAISE